MPRYYFHSADGERDIDHDGIELPDHATARREAVRYAGHVMGDQPDVLWDGRDFRIEVTDDTRTLLFTIIMLAVDAPSARDLAG